MNLPLRSRGGNPAGYISELGGIEAGAVHYLHLWCDGPLSQAEARHEITKTLGPAHGKVPIRNLEDICQL